jgi:hypothetical protein
MIRVSQLRSLVIALSEPVWLYLVPIEMGDTVSLNGESYVDCGLGHWVGFYDWLRDADGDIRGVRSWLSGAGTEALRQELARNSAVELGEREVRIWLTEDRRFDERNSDDRDFGTHRIMRTSRHKLAVTFNVENLSGGELEALAKIVAATWRRKRCG